MSNNMVPPFNTGRFNTGWSNITPFSYENGMTHWELIEKLRKYVTDVIYPAIAGGENGGGIPGEITRIDAELGSLANRISDNDTDIAELFADVQGIIDNSVVAQDPVVADIISNVGSLTRDALSSWVDEQGRLGINGANLDDLNEVTDSGWYRTTGSTLNKPVADSSAMVVQALRWGSDSVVQVAYGINRDSAMRMWRRTHTSSGGWANWEEVPTQSSIISGITNPDSEIYSAIDEVHAVNSMFVTAGMFGQTDGNRSPEGLLYSHIGQNTNLPGGASAWIMPEGVNSAISVAVEIPSGWHTMDARILWSHRNQTPGSTSPRFNVFTNLLDEGADLFETDGASVLNATFTPAPRVVGMVDIPANVTMNGEGHVRNIVLARMGAAEQDAFAAGVYVFGIRLVRTS